MGRPALTMEKAIVTGAEAMSPARFKNREMDTSDDRLLDDDLNPLLYECAPPLLLDVFERAAWDDFVKRSFWLRASEYQMAHMTVKLIAKLNTNTLFDKDWTMLMNLLCKMGCSVVDRGKIQMKKKADKKKNEFY